ncbi:WAP four-disulfide core domain protein 3-like [Melospiza georgiana]|uniref:WAP four-disulfide core domain protein 3-like n=1 Tax=Melospiza georgiana TaxID=44398 RepID=UPI0025ACEC9F|nr:WAP four-disulfide core domain protein 3-like [Melospiza georgiana]
MLGHPTLLVLLALLTLAQQHSPRVQGAALALPASPHGALQGHWTPTAPPAPPKVGECPAGASGAPWPPSLYCLSDHGCPGAEKCCQSGKVWTCLLPTTESPGYCPRAGSAIGPSCGTRCHNDTSCQSGEKCCPRGCCTRCVLAEPAKPGLCPRKRAQSRAAACPNRCTDDRDCPGEHKCCFSGCGLACTPPDTGSHHATAKPGVCPMVLRGSLGPCLELCDTDSDCTGDSKCCTTGCGHICKPPTKGKPPAPCGDETPVLSPHAWPGLCSPAAEGDQAAKCLLLCLQDKDCDGTSSDSNASGHGPWHPQLGH